MLVCHYVGHKETKDPEEDRKMKYNFEFKNNGRWEDFGIDDFECYQDALDYVTFCREEGIDYFECEYRIIETEEE